MNITSEFQKTQTIVPTPTMDQMDPVVFDSSKHVALKERRRPQVLIVSEGLENRETLVDILRREGRDALSVSRVSECREVLLEDDFNLVFCDRRLPDGTYLEVLAVTQSLGREPRVVVTSRNADWEQYLEALRYGAFELIVSPCKGSDVVWVLSQAKREDYKRAAFGQRQAGSAPL
jgi:DNA-binding NtrC family response regulator